MALPTGITTCVVSAGAPLDFAGTGGTIFLTVAPDLGGNANHITWSATGQPLVNFASSASADAGQQATVVLPHVDQPGFIDGSGNAATNWSYKATITFTGPNRQKIAWTKTFQLLQGQTAVDLDMIPDGSITSQTSAPIPAVTSVGGQTGAVTLDSLGLLSTTDVGVAGGVAGLDASGDVVDASGQTVVSAATKAAAVANLPAPFYIAHRGGPLLAPEESMTAYRTALLTGADVLEADVYLLGDGTLGIMHDATVDRTTNGTGDLSNFSLPSYQKLTIASQRLMGTTGWPVEGPPTVEQWLREFGNRACLAPQMYDDDAFPVFDALVNRLGIDKGTIILQTTSGVVSTQALAAGYATMILGNFDTADFTAAGSRGDTYAGMPAAGVTQQHVDNAHAQGLQLIPYAVSSHQERDTLLALGCDGMFSDDAGYTKGAFASRTSDLFVAQEVTSGHALIGGSRPAFTAPDILSFPAVSGQVSTCRLGYIRPADPQNFTLTWDTRFVSGSSGNTRMWIGDDLFRYPSAAADTFNGYLFTISYGGTLTLERYVNAVRAEYMGYQTALTGVTPNVWMPFQVTVTPTTIAWTKIDTGNTDTRTPSSGTVIPLKTLCVSCTTAAVDFRHITYA